MLYLTTLFLLTMPLNAQDCGLVSSENASYDGQDLILSGHVIIDHILGRMQAKKALLKRQEKINFPFNQIELDQEVLILLKEHGRITADRADFDLQKNQGILNSDQEQNVTYQDMIYDKKEKLVPFTIEGRSLKLNLLLKEEKNREYLIDSICAEQDVAISYANAFFLTAAKATYNQLDLINQWKGFISAYGQDEDTSCCLTHEQDIVYAKQIDINLIDSYLQLFYAKGILQSFLPPKTEKSSLHFSTDSLHWNDLEKKLLFKGPTQIEEQSIGIIHTQDELTIKNCMVNNKMIFQTLDAKGHTVMTCKDLKGRNHRIESHGRLHIDQNKLQAWIESLPDQEGNIQNPLYYEAEDFNVFSDNAQLDYININQHVKPSSIVLKEHVLLFSKGPNKPDQLAIADKMSYSLDTQSIILSAHPGKKVLFWDALQELKISAFEVHITTDCLTQEKVIKGIGRVQFDFSKEEQTQFNQHFPQFASHE
ncbi:hypothetical protein [Candidatus Rhabdochlamydia porcellionis]|jgi:hypothetical protein|uniref:Organic solvent tolerance-like N-terminal domain-containing protein n=1 Tax=Candidatus Rhabdochlamydia porcellionis TaxID=225148 RepID=A0ABX8Z0J0_9BACT|nr:hypothetical protein [Candidatus Rhabdochlamydia porcellionis]QZA59190.1 hypothetical protein RHAB15C_0001075 [Candidatus Rhabdochlamydia porcellionis]